MTSRSRRLALPKSHPKSRNDLDAAIVNSVDNCLKYLRKTSRRLPATLSSHALEVHLLERIIYKSKNQHRKTLFFRNLVEIKRFAARIEEASLSKLVETIRAAFYSQGVASSSAWKTSPWSQVPDARVLESILQRIEALLQLYMKAIDAYEKASVAFGRFSHSTAFLPLSITALGIAARLCMLSVELVHVAQQTWKGIHQLLAELEPLHRACRCKSTEFHENFDSVRELVEEPPAQQGATNNLDHELGEMVARTVHTDMSMPEVDAFPLQVSGSSPLPHADVDMQETEDVISFSMAAPIIRSVQRETSARGVFISSFGDDERTQNAGRRKRKKKAQLLDEIDGIFGQGGLLGLNTL